MALVPTIKRGEARFLDTIKELADPRPMISDAYWSATHPIDRMTGKGRSSGPQMLMYPWGSKFPPKWFPVGPPEKGLHAVRLPVSRNVPLDAKTKDSLTWRGNLMGTNYFQNPQRGVPRTVDQRHHYAIEAASRRARAPYSQRTPTGSVRDLHREDNGTPVSYNIVNDDGKVVGSSHMQFYPDKTEVKEVFLKPEYQGNLEIFRDMVGPALDRGVPVDAVAGNPKIGRILSRMAQKNRKSGNAGVVEGWNRDVPRGQWGRSNSTRRGRAGRPGSTDAYYVERGRVAREKGQPFLEDLLDLGTDIQTRQLQRRRNTNPAEVVAELPPWFDDTHYLRPSDPARQQLRNYAPAHDVPEHISDAYGRGAGKTPGELAAAREAGRNIQQASYHRAVEEHQAMLRANRNRLAREARARRFREEELARQRRGLGRRGGE